MSDVSRDSDGWVFGRLRSGILYDAGQRTQMSKSAPGISTSYVPRDNGDARPAIFFALAVAVVDGGREKREREREREEI